MTARLTDAQFDREIVAFLDRASRDVAAAPSASEMAVLVARHLDHLGPSTSRRLPRTAMAWLLMAAVVASLLAAATFFIGSRPPVPATVQNGWIAISTQPGYRQTFETDWGIGSDIYLFRQGDEARLIVERGPDMKRNVCPAFSPDGSMLVYGELAGTDASLVVLDVGADGRVAESRRLSVPGSSRLAPCPRWSRNGTHLAYLDGLRWDGDGVSATPGTRVAVMSLDGAAVDATADDPSVDDLRRSVAFDPLESPRGQEPLLSPDGKSRAMCLQNIGFVIGPADGSTYERLLSSTACNYSLAAWSPDGGQILLMSDGGRTALVHVLPARSGMRAGGDYIGEIPVNGLRSWPGRGDVSWQSVRP